MSVFSLRACRIYPVDFLLVTAFAVAAKLCIDISLVLARILEQAYLASSLNTLAELASGEYVMSPGSINGDLACRMFLFPMFLGLTTFVLVLRARYAETAGFDLHRLVYRRWKRHGPPPLTNFLIGKTTPAKSILFAMLALQGLLYAFTFYFLARSFARIYYFSVNGYSTHQFVYLLPELLRVTVFAMLAAAILSQCRKSEARYLDDASAAQ